MRRPNHAVRTARSAVFREVLGSELEGFVHRYSEMVSQVEHSLVVTKRCPQLLGSDGEVLPFDNQD
jgi:hypothetical protein